MDENVLQKYARGNDNIETEDLMYTRTMHFKLNGLSEDKWNQNEERGRNQTPPGGTMRWNYLDSLMEQVPGKDGPNAVLHDDSFDIATTEYADNSQSLNTAYYSRFFAFDHADAMGRKEQMRGYSDQNLFAAMTTHNKVAGHKYCSEEDDSICWEQKWTYAVPLEIVYLTPMQKWNPYNLTSYGKRDFDEINVESTGDIDDPFEGFSERDYFHKLPSMFYSDEAGRDLADTGNGHYVRDENGNAVHVTASGTRIISDFIGDGVGQVRLRWPIFPIHEHSSLAFREVSALGKKTRAEFKLENDDLRSKITNLENAVENLLDLLKGSSDFSALIDGAQDINLSTEPTTTADDLVVGKWTEATYPSPVLSTDNGVPDHTHDIWCDWTCFRSLMNGEQVTIVSENWDGHAHEFTFHLNPDDNQSFVFDSCDSCATDTHSELIMDPDNPEAFLPF